MTDDNKKKVMDKNDKTPPDEPEPVDYVVPILWTRSLKPIGDALLWINKEARPAINPHVEFYTEYNPAAPQEHDLVHSDSESESESDDNDYNNG